MTPTHIGSADSSGARFNTDPKAIEGAKKTQLHLLPPVALAEAAKAHQQGADKYGPFNWRETKVCASTYISAMMRHLDLWRDGEDLAPDSGVSHLGHIIAGANILLDAAHCGTLVDDRAKMPDQTGRFSDLA